MIQFEHPRNLSDAQFHNHLVSEHGYHPEEIANSGRATGNPGRAALTDLHNFSHQNTNYGLDPKHAGESPWPGDDIPHTHPEWAPGRTNSFNEGARHLDTGNQAHLQDGR